MDTNAVVIAFSALTGGISAVSTLKSFITGNQPKPKVVMARVAVVIVSVVVIAFVFVSPPKSLSQPRPTPESADAHYQRGKQYFFEHNRPQAIYEAKQAIAINPAHEEAHKLLGACYGIDENMDAAASEYKEATAINPDDIEVQLGLATADEACGNRQKAPVVYRYIISNPLSTPNQRRIASSQIKNLGG